MTITKLRLAEPRDDLGWERLSARLAPVLLALGGNGDVARLGLRDVLGRNAAPAPTRSDATTVTVRGYGSAVVIGPVSGPFGQPCGRCLDRRWQAVRSKDLRDALELGGSTTPAGPGFPMTDFGIDAVAMLVRQLYAAGSEASPGAAPIVLLDLATLRTRRFTLTADPECTSCAELSVDRREDAIIALNPEPKAGPLSFRLRDLDDIHVDETALANPVCGVLGPAVVREMDSPTTASTYGKMDLRTDVYLHESFWGGHTFRYVNSAKVGLLEGLERYAGMRSRAKATGTVDSLACLRERGVRLLDPRDVGLYDDRVYTDTTRRIGRFSEDSVIPWVWGYSLRDQEPVLVPELLSYYHSVPLGERFVQECSNGCASGSSLVEATYFGLMELIERDSFMLAWYGRLELPEIDGRSSTTVSTRALIDRLAMHGYQARFFDARISFDVPVIIGAAERFDGGIGRLCFGAGASLDPEEALRAAVIEIGTDAPHLARRTIFNHPKLAPMVHDFDRVIGLHDHPLLYGLPEMREHAAFLLHQRPTMSLAEAYRRRPIAPSPSMDLSQDVTGCVAAVTAEGLDTIVVDQTLDLQRRMGMRTASVIIPGLLPIDFGWTRQRALLASRLRKAPRKAGITDHDLTGADLNYAPHPFP